MSGPHSPERRARRGRELASAPRLSRPRAVVAVAAALCAVARPGWAAPPQPQAPPAHRASFLATLWAEANHRLGEVAGTRRVPPVPVAVSWQPRRWGVVDVGAPLLDMTAVDVNGDRRAELAMVSTAEVLVVGRGAGGGPAVLARAPLPVDPAEIRPRDPVGAIAVDRTARGGARILARSSEQAEGAMYALGGGGALKQVGRVPGFPLCAGVRAELASGRNYFETASVDWPALSGPFYAARCARDLVGPDGRALAARAVLGMDGALVVRVTPRCDGGGCGDAAARKQIISAVGTAFAIADVDRDGAPEVIASDASAPGQPDRVRVISLAGGRARVVFQMNVAGPIAGLAAGDVDGDGAPEVVVAVRVAGSPSRVALWTLN